MLQPHFLHVQNNVPIDASFFRLLNILFSISHLAFIILYKVSRDISTHVVIINICDRSVLLLLLLLLFAYFTYFNGCSTPFILKFPSYISIFSPILSHISEIFSLFTFFLISLMALLLFCYAR